jgi:hypothetical protein
MSLILAKRPAMSLIPARVVEYVVDNGKRVGNVIDTSEYGGLRH